MQPAEPVVLETPPRTLSLSETKFANKQSDKTEESIEFPIKEGLETPGDAASSRYFKYYVLKFLNFYKNIPTSLLFTLRLLSESLLEVFVA